MDAVLYVSTVMAMLAASQVVAPHVAAPVVAPRSAASQAVALQGAASMLPVAHELPSTVAAFPGEDKFRHIGMSWATTTFAYAAARAAGQDGDAALAVALPVSVVFGLGKEIADHGRGGEFSSRDMLANAVGTAAAWLLLREVR